MERILRINCARALLGKKKLKSETYFRMHYHHPQRHLEKLGKSRWLHPSAQTKMGQYVHTGKGHRM